MDDSPDPTSLGSLGSAVTLGIAYGLAWGIRYVFDAYTKRQRAKRRERESDPDKVIEPREDTKRTRRKTK